MDLEDIARQHDSFLVPAFAIKIDGLDLLRVKNIAVAGVEAEQVLNGTGRFSFTVLNTWDITARKFLYGNDSVLELLKFGAPVEIRMGYGSTQDLPLIMRGTITEISTNFPESGYPELTVAGSDLLFPLTLGKRSHTWSRVKNSDVVTQILNGYNLSGDIAASTVTKPQIEQNQQSDMDFILNLAKDDSDANFYIDDRKVRYGAARSDEAAALSMKWGRGLISFKPEANLSGQVTEVLVLGRDVANNADFIGRASANTSTSEQDRSSVGAVLATQIPNTPLRVRRPVSSQAEADALARAILADRTGKKISGDGECFGWHALRPDTSVDLQDLGDGFSGKYYIEKVTHKVDVGGYRCKFKVKS
jgi:phage protein D